MSALLVSGMLVATPAPALAPPPPATSPPPTAGDPAPVIDSTREQPTDADIAEVAGAEGRARVIVSLRSRITPEGALDPAEVTTQREEIRAAQDELIADLAGTDARVVRTFDTIPAVSVELTPEGVDSLATSEVVATVTREVPARPTLGGSVDLIGGGVAHADGFGGRRRSIAILDTGVDSTHPFLAGRVVDEACFSTAGSCPNGETTMAGPGSAMPCTFSSILCRHGTHVAGIAAGRRTAEIPFDGVAPDAGIVAMQIFSEESGPICLGAPSCAIAWPADQLDRVVKLAKKHRIAAVNMSLGAFLFTEPCDFGAGTVAVANLASLGVATVVSSGNDGSIDAISAPGCVPGVVSVGATTRSDTVASFSNSASFLSLLAPGVGITSSVPGGSVRAFSGTSMAAPHVAGAFAVLAQSAPEAGVAAILDALVTTGVPVLDTRNQITTPRIDIAAARTALAPVVTPGVGSRLEGPSGNSRLEIPVTLSAPSGARVTVQYTTISVTTEAGSDFRAKTGTLSFPPGVTAKTAKVTIWGDGEVESDEVFLVAFSAVAEATIGGFYGLGAGIIVNDD